MADINPKAAKGSGSKTRVPTRSLKGKKISPDILKYIPQESAGYYRFVPIGIKDGTLEIGIVDPDNMEARNAVSFIADKLGMPFKFFLISVEDYEEVLGSYGNITSEVNKVLGELDSELAGDGKAPEQVIASKSESENVVALVEDAPITKIVAVIIRHAIDGSASDIHIEPTSGETRVRFRVDGILHKSLSLPANVHEAVVGRIKIITSLKLDEKRVPQDGRFSAPLDGRRVDFRVSTFPSYFGEKVVIRILDTEKGISDINNLGLREEHQALIKRALAQPYGLILLTGPTGSGKSTTLYAMLNELDRERYNVVSLEDPVEYNVPGVSQSQVRPEIGYSFADGLRSVLRQDPDMIMVGEIRDAETAKLAIQAALTGHLVFSTLHTNNSIGVIPRLVDMGVDPYLIAPTLKLAIAQRLVRRSCEDAREPVPIEGAIRTFIDKELKELPTDVATKTSMPGVIYRVKPTPSCPTGTRGRIAAFEMYEVGREMERIILDNPVEEAILGQAREQGMVTMREDAILKSFEGIIPFDEVNTL